MQSGAGEQVQPQKELCFLVGAPRCGTTWFQRLLQAHPDICGGEESDFFTIFGGPLRAAVEIFNQSKSRGGLGPLSYVSTSTYEDLFRIVWNKLFSDLYNRNHQCKVHLEKTPHHILALNEIVQLFPKARIIIMLRDSRAVTSSMVHASNSWGGYWAPKSYKKSAVRWYVYMKAFQTWRLTHPDHPCFVIRYEDAIKNPNEALRGALQFLSVKSDNDVIEGMLGEYASTEPQRPDPPGFSRKRGAEGWRKDMSLYGKLVTWRYTRKMMRELGYGCHAFK